VVRWHKLYGVGLVLLLGGALVLATHLLTMRNVSAELERWSALGHSLTETAQGCIAMLPTAWAIERGVNR
jgi:hypothetical protein